ncbi:AMP-binding protein, partial [Stenotrophomonas maltophilia]|nr:AMP-binding protein [Stenotrophomonas maltophilia]MBN5136541.1 AMP-binding protein [Stenotrophomonas maltophilia]
NADGELAGELVYDQALFEHRSAEHMVEQYQTLLAAVLASPHTPLCRLSLISESDRAWLLAQGMRSRSDDRPKLGIHEHFALQVERTPDAIAVQHDDLCISYATLDAWSDAWADLLRKAGIGLGGRVGLYMTATPELAAGMLAVLKVGAGYVPLEGSCPLTGLDYVMGDSGVSLVLTDREDLPWRYPVAWKRVRREDMEEAVALRTDRSEAVANAARLPAYVMYTAGSRDQPHGVQVDHRNVVRAVVAVNGVSLQPGDVIPQMSSPACAASTFEVWGALLNGGRLVHVPRDVALDPLRLGEAVKAMRASVMTLTSTLFGALAQHDPQALRDVREVLVGGEVISNEALRRVHDQGRPQRLLNAYATAGTTSFSVIHEVGDPRRLQRCTLGTPMAHSSAHVLDTQMNLLPPGMAGELYLGGDGVAIGYVGQPALTAERFVPDPFAGHPGARLFRTGDRARWNTDGQLELLGDLERRVTIRGFRVDTEDVAARVLAQPGIGQAVVILREDLAGGRALVAYVVTTHDGVPSMSALREQLLRVLPDYLVPVAFVALPSLPLTPAGKLDRNALPVPNIAPTTVAYLPPETEVESVVAEVWQNLLSVERVGRYDNFFVLGGHSLLAARAVVRLKEVLQVEVEVRDLFTAPQLSTFADLLLERQLSQFDATELLALLDTLESPMTE